MWCWEGFGLSAVSVNSHFVFGFLMWYLSLVFRLVSIFAHFTYQHLTPSQAKGLLNSSNRFKVHHKLRCGAKEKQRRDLLIFLPLWEELNWVQNCVPIHLPLTGQPEQHTSFLRSILHYHKNISVVLSDQEVGFLQANLFVSSVPLVLGRCIRQLCLLKIVSSSFGSQANDLHF